MEKGIFSVLRYKATGTRCIMPKTLWLWPQQTHLQREKSPLFPSSLSVCSIAMLSLGKKVFKGWVFSSIRIGSSFGNSINHNKYARPSYQTRSKMMLFNFQEWSLSLIFLLNELWNTFFQGLVISKLAGMQCWRKSRSENSKRMGGKISDSARRNWREL